MIDYTIQLPEYLEFARRNTHGVRLNETEVISMERGLDNCLVELNKCYNATHTENMGTYEEGVRCNYAAYVCYVQVEMIWSTDRPGNHRYDIRGKESSPRFHFLRILLAIGWIQQAIGVDLNYTSIASGEVLEAFNYNGDRVRNQALEDLSELLNAGTRVVLVYGDADYQCNWFGGEAVSLAINFTGSDKFRAAGYAPLEVDRKRYGNTKEAGNFSFTRIFDAGHIGYDDKPAAFLEIFKRSISGHDIASGTTGYVGHGTKGQKHSSFNQSAADTVGHDEL
jgi:carboxypeptidase C (cathepsin A)